MTPLKLGNSVAGRRAAAGLCAAALIVALASFPLRARAVALGGVLPAVGGAVAVTLFLNACGIYPFQDENGESFGEWGARKLSDMWTTYVTEVYPQSDAAQVIEDVKAFYASGGYVTMAANTWEKLRGFATWLTSKFGLSSGQTGVEMVNGDGTFTVPVFSTVPSADWLRHDGWHVLDSLYAGVSAPGLRPFFHRALTSDFLAVSSPFESDFELYLTSRSTALARYNDVRTIDVGGTTFYYITLATSWTFGVPDGFYSYASVYEGISGVWGDNPRLPTKVMADIGSLAVPDALPEGVEMGGLAVPGAVTVEAVEAVAAQGVMERQRPTVRPVEVTIAEGTEIDTETGVISGAGTDGVVIDEAETVPAASVFAIPASLVSDFTYALQHKFPLCIPFDALRIVQAFVKTPSAPEIRLTFTDPFSGTECNFVVSLSPWDDVAAVIRELQSLLLLVGFMLNAPKVLFLRDLLVP